LDQELEIAGRRQFLHRELRIFSSVWPRTASAWKLPRAELRCDRGGNPAILDEISALENRSSLLLGHPPGLLNEVGILQHAAAEVPGAASSLLARRLMCVKPRMLRSGERPVGESVADFFPRSD